MLPRAAGSLPAAACLHPALPTREAKAEQRKASGSGIPAGSPPARQRAEKAAAGKGLQPWAQPRLSQTGDVLPKTATPGQERWWGLGVSTGSVLWQLNWGRLGCSRASQLLSCCYSIYFSRLAYRGHALEITAASSQNLPSECGQKIMESPVPLAEGQCRGGVESWYM